MASEGIVLVASTPAKKNQTITQFYQRVRVTNYIEQFNKDPLRLSNERILWDECEWVASGPNHVLARKERGPGGKAIPAEVRLIGEIDEDKFRLYADGGWDGRFDEGLEKAKASAKLACGRIPEVSVLWESFLGTLDEIVMARGPTRVGRKFPIVENARVKIRYKIFELARTQGSKDRTRRIERGLDPVPSFDLKPEETSTPVSKMKKLHDDDNGAGVALQEEGNQYDFVQVEFEMPDPNAEESIEAHANKRDIVGRGCSPADSVTSFAFSSDDVLESFDDSVHDDNDTVSSSDETASEFDPVNWPCQTSKAKEELTRIISVGDYIARPIPVFTLDGERVPPSEYETRLKGALVDVTLTITNVTYRQWGFFGDIVSIVIIAPPGYGPAEEAVATRGKKRISKPPHLKKFLRSEKKMLG